MAISQSNNQDASGSVVVAGEGTAGTPAGGLVSTQTVDRSGSGTIAAVNATVVVMTRSASVVNFAISGTFSAIMGIQASVDGGTTYFPINGTAISTGGQPAFSPTGTISGAGLYSVLCGGFTNVQLIALSYASGTVTANYDVATGTSTIQVITPRVILTPLAATSVSVGTTSVSVVAANFIRKGLVLTNSSANTISLNLLGGTAVLRAGITLLPSGGTFVMDEFTFTNNAITAIASAAASVLSIQEFS